MTCAISDPDRSQVVDFKDGEMSEWLKEHAWKAWSSVDSSANFKRSVSGSHSINRTADWSTSRKPRKPSKSRVPVLYLHPGFHAFQAIRAAEFLQISWTFRTAYMFKSSLPQTTLNCLVSTIYK
jgi:hypothetical protein